MAERTSALDGHLTPGIHGLEPEEGPGVTLTLLRDLILSQVAAWPDTVETAAATVLETTRATHVPAPGGAVEVGDIALLRVEPLKCWIVGADVPSLDPTLGTSLDLSHSRTRIRVSGPQTAALLNRFLPLDLRESAFPVGSVATSVLHHVGVTLWRRSVGYELFIPRGFALSCWEVLFATARQFGVRVSESVCPGAGEAEALEPGSGPTVQTG